MIPGSRATLMWRRLNVFASAAREMVIDWLVVFLKVIACEIAVRELCQVAAGSRQLIDFEFLTQGYHDTPAAGRAEIQKRIDAAPAGKYDAILLGYGLCSNILAGITTPHTPLVIPRAHDCITLFLGSKERYQQCFAERPGTYYYTSGWLECSQRRGGKGAPWGGMALQLNASLNLMGNYEQWAQKYGEEQAKYLLAEMSRWSEAYSHGTLIDFDFVKHLRFDEQVRKICADKGWQYDEIGGDLRLFRKLLDGEWAEPDFLVVRPGQKVVPTFDERIIGVAPA
jgi:hypothetical protein